MPTFRRGKPPGPNAGRISPDTTRIRPKTGMTEEQEKLARQMCRDGMALSDIATHFSVTEAQAAVATATVRTRTTAPKRSSLNVSLTVGQYIRGQALPDESVWQTMERLVEELEQRRSGGTPLSS